MAKYGHCQCGCGAKTSIAPRNKANRGHIKGRPVRFLVGHGSRLSPVEYLVKNTGYKTPCWIWQRSIRPNGYAQMPHAGTITYAHIVFYERKFGQVYEGKMLDHLCRVRKCVNPDHLEPVTNQVNSQRGAKTKLNPEIVIEMRKLRASGLSCMKISRQMKIPCSTVFYVSSGYTWSNVE